MNAPTLDRSITRLALNYSEAARALGIARNTLVRLVEEDAIRPVRVGRRYLFPVCQLEEFLSEGGEGSY